MPDQPSRPQSEADITAPDPQPDVVDVSGRADFQQSAIRRVKGDRLHANMSAIGFSQSGTTETRMSAVGASFAAHTDIETSTAAIVGGGSVRMQNSAAQWVVGGNIEATNVATVALIGASVTGNVKTLMGTRSAIAFGVALGFSSLIVRLIRRFL